MAVTRITGAQRRHSMELDQTSEQPASNNSQSHQHQITSAPPTAGSRQYSTVAVLSSKPGFKGALALSSRETTDEIASYLSNDSKSLFNLARTCRALYDTVIPLAAIARLNEIQRSDIEGEQALRVFIQLASYPKRSSHQARLIEKFYPGASAAARALYSLTGDGAEVTRFLSLLALTNGFKTHNGTHFVPNDKQKAELLAGLLTFITYLPEDQQLKAVNEILGITATLPFEHQDPVLFEFASQIENFSEIDSPVLLPAVNAFLDALDQLPSKLQGRLLTKFTKHLSDMPVGEGFSSVPEGVTKVTNRNTAIGVVTDKIGRLDSGDKPTVITGLAEAIDVFDGTSDTDREDAGVLFEHVFALNMSLRPDAQGPGLIQLADRIGSITSPRHRLDRLQSILAASNDLPELDKRRVQKTLARRVDELEYPGLVTAAKQLLRYVAGVDFSSLLEESDSDSSEDH